MHEQLESLEQKELNFKNDSDYIKGEIAKMKSMLELVTKALDEKHGQFKLKYNE